ncbi:MAG: hypothetical protein ACLQQ4_06630 [Bacteroidia bacterium]
MKHEFIGEPIYVSSRICEITIRLVPENEIETKAILNSETLDTTEAESGLINNYFLFKVLNWSILSIKGQKGNIFKLRAVDI